MLQVWDNISAFYTICPIKELGSADWPDMDEHTEQTNQQRIAELPHLLAECNKQLAQRDATGTLAIWMRITGVLAVYLAGALLFFIPIGFNITGALVARQLPDASHAIWFYAWWPYAIGHVLNPLYTYQVWAPVGYNLLCNRSRAKVAKL